MDQERVRTLGAITQAQRGDEGRAGTAQRLAHVLFAKGLERSEVEEQVLDAVAAGAVRRRLTEAAST